MPFTKAADGDSLDVPLPGAPAFPGCLVEARLLGTIEIEQHETDSTVLRNDHLLAVCLLARAQKPAL